MNSSMFVNADDPAIETLIQKAIIEFQMKY